MPAHFKGAGHKDDIILGPRSDVLAPRWAMSGALGRLATPTHAPRDRRERRDNHLVRQIGAETRAILEH